MLTPFRSLDYTVLLCRNTEVMKRFYQDVLGLPLHRDFGDWVEFQVGANLLTLRTRGTGYDGVRDHDGAASTGASCQLAFRVPPAEVDRCFARLSDRRVDIIQGPVNQEGTGHRTLFFKDPENNILEVYAEI